MTRRTLQLLLLATMTSAGAMGQINCTSGPAAQKLVCEFPFATGVLTNDSALGGTTNGSSGSQTALQLATGINISIATQVSQLPLASASAGTVVLYKAGVPETFNNLGPILTDRAQTVGRHKLFLGFTASQFVFTDIDGINLGRLPFGYVQTAFVPGTHTLLSNTYTTENTSLKFRIDQFIGVATLGLTNKMDLTVIVPTERVSLGATTFGAQSYIVSSSNVIVFGPYSTPGTYSPGTASGVGDINFILKSELWRGEHATASAAMQIRAPSGDDLNYLGSGAWGFDPYFVYSYLWKVSPHAKIGYQWNTKSELNNPTNKAGGNLNLPGGVQYDFGADWAAKKRLTVAADLLGNQYLNTPRLVTTSTTLTTSTGPLSLASSVSGNSSYSINNLSAGLKLNPVGNLVLSGNVLFQLNNNGLRARPTPLLGISYKF
jgi:hypothetical protein